MSLVRVTMEAADLADGERMSPDLCAVALACRRSGLVGSIDGEGPEADPWSRPTFDGYYQGEHVYVALPPEVGSFAGAFDRGEMPAPITFDVDLDGGDLGS